MLALALSVGAGNAAEKTAPVAAEGASVAQSAAGSSGDAKAKETKALDVIYVPTPQAVVDKMLELAEVKKGDVVYDLGCGDGRIVVAAAKRFGVKAIGFDIDPQRVKEAREKVREAGVEHLVTIRQEDIFSLDLREATVVTLYLLPNLNVRLMPQLAQLRAGARIVSHDFDMRGAKPVAEVRLSASDPSTNEAMGDEDGEHTIYKWVVPWTPEPGPTKSAPATSP